MRLWDSLANIITGMGTAKAKSSATVYAYAPMAPGELEAAYRGSWLARKVIDIPAKDMCREWRLWQAEDDQIEKLEAEEIRLGLQAKTLEAKRKARLFGGAAIVISDGTEDLSEELRPESVGLQGIRFLTVMTCRSLTAGEVETDPLSPWCGQPKHYHMRSSRRDVQIHPSRLVRHVGSVTAEDEYTGTVTGWGDSSLEAVHRALKDAETAAANISEMTHEAKLDIVKVPDLMAFAADADYEARFQRRTQLAMIAKSMHNTLLLDKEEEYEQKQVSFGTLPDVLDRFLQIASGAADIPATRLLGQSPAGMNATGESDLRNYYDRIGAEQRLELGPAMALFDECLIRSALGTRPPEIHYKWAPLWQMGEKDRAEVNLKNAQAFQIDVNSGLFPDSALSKGRINQCVEAGTYPGLENALDEAEGEGDAIDFAAKADEPAPAPVVRMQAAANDGEGEEGADL